MFQQTKTKEKSCSTNLVWTPIPQKPQLIPTPQEQQEPQFSQQQQIVIENNNELIDNVKHVHPNKHYYPQLIMPTTNLNVQYHQQLTIPNNYRYTNRY